jgi:octaprenyl-diphosphate synthase
MSNNRHEAKRFPPNPIHKGSEVNSLALATGKEVFDLLREDLEAIEREFGGYSVSNVHAITEIGDYLRQGGGKRLRPALLLLAAKLLNYSGAGAVRLGAVVEIIHTATLVHDDIIDEAETRRGRPSPNTIWGNPKCVLAGDWLYMQAFQISLEERNLLVLDLLTELTKQMVEGELMQMEKLGSLISRDSHLDLIYRKTACLFAVCMQLGGVLAGATEQQQLHLREYGRAVGMAFQITDDVLDLTASELVLGKPVASDLREGKATLAVIHALEHCTDAERAQIQTVLEQRAFNGVTHQDILAILARYESIGAANQEAAKFARHAAAQLTDFPDNEFKRALLWIPKFVVAREK